MSYINNHLYNLISNSVKEAYGIELTFKNSYRLDLFPRLVGREIHVNEKLNIILELFNSGITYGINTGYAIGHYIMFQSFWFYNDYENADFHLSAFEDEVDEIIKVSHPASNALVNNAHNYIQVFYILLHESFHALYGARPDIKAMALETTEAIMQDIKEEYRDTEKDDNRDVEVMCEYFDLIADGKEQNVAEEISCDRQAWLNLINDVQRSQNPTDEEIMVYHQIVFMTLSIMDLTKVLQSVYNPKIKDAFGDDTREIFTRQIAFKALLRQYNEKVWEMVTNEYNNLAQDLLVIYDTALEGLKEYTDDITALYKKEYPRDIIGNSQRNKLSETMKLVEAKFLGCE